MPAAIFADSLTNAPGDSLFEPPARDTVLVVDDNDFVAGLMTCIIERSGRAVIRAACGAECERQLGEHEPGIALVILDCRLPDTDGIALCGRLRARFPGLRVLLTSGQNYAGPRAVSGGPTAFLAKPFLRAQLEETIGRLLGTIA